MTRLTKEKQSALDWLEENSAEMYGMSDAIFKWAEPGLREYKSSRLLAEYMDKNGFTVETGVADMPTAFTCAWGDQGPVIGFFAEYDATPEDWV